ncbi:DUF3114 domain-containing protein [Streptococcus sp. A11]|uniref:DUF3114 domain-containing protein n=1 Tax=unclassified Streptococcus TaxID=2608887 RepID=UPI00374DA261
MWFIMIWQVLLLAVLICLPFLPWRKCRTCSIPLQAKRLDQLTFASLACAETLKEMRRNLDQASSAQLVDQIIAILDFPEELEQKHLTWLMGQMDQNLPPHHAFWREFAGLVDLAYPDESLPKKVHQLRYLISYQQADWVRRHYGQGKSDWQALTSYLSTLPRRSYQLRQSARLHNKQLFRREKLTQSLPLNIKVLIHFHSEFILDEKGNFALILDETPTLNGQVNGASFNYARANNRRHYQLDMKPVGPHDPVYRKKILRSKAGAYLSPVRIYWFQLRKSKVGWDHSYFNRQGIFSFGGNSRAAQVAKLRKEFSRDIGFRLCQKIKSWYNKE